MSRQNRRVITKVEVLLLLCLALLVVPDFVRAQTQVTGTIYHDQNKNGRYDSGESGVPGVQVSNGSDIVVTDKAGNYDVTAGDNTTIFVIKPGGWRTAINDNNVPGFSYTYSTQGAEGTRYPGLEPVDEWSESVDFALYPQREPDTFRAVVFGDTQPRNRKEVNYIMHDTVQELVGVDAAFGITLGDLVFDNLNLFDPINEIVGEIGIPWRHVMGNHDIDHSANTEWDANGAYYRTYGPSYYAFQWGAAHFVVVDNIRWVVENDERYYRTGLGEDQMEFISNYLESVPGDELVMFLMHIPWVGSTEWKDEAERRKLFSLLASYPNTVSLAAHMHRHYHRFIDAEDGWPGEEPHHLMSMGAVCGAWWAGAPDEYGIPHSMMRDGTPTGYGFLEIRGNEWKLRYKAARRPPNFQMHIYAPDELSLSDTDSVEVFANVFNALPDARVRMRVGKSGSWQAMKRVKKADPFYKEMRAREHALGKVDWRKSGKVNPDARHLWQAILPADIEPGAHTIHIRAEDDWGVYEGRRIVRVKN